MLNLVLFGLNPVFMPRDGDKHKAFTIALVEFNRPGREFPNFLDDGLGGAGRILSNKD